MRPATIVKDPKRLRLTPNLVGAGRGDVPWSTGISGLPDGRGLNIAYEAVDRHAASARAGKIALRFIRKNGEIDDMSFADLAAASARFANVLRSLGVSAGDAVFALTGRIPELYAAALGTLKNRSVFSPLFSQFGPEPLETRLALGGAKVLVTTTKLYEKKVRAMRDHLPLLAHVALVDGSLPGTLDLRALLAAASTTFEIPATDKSDPALLHFTSGTTGKPKGAVHVHEAVVVHHLTGKLILDLHDDDIFWCTADPGWVTGTSYGIVAPLTCGVTSVVDEADFDAERWYRILAEQKVSVWYTAPTAVRMLMKAGPELPKRFDLSQLRFAGSVGEPLNPEAVWWGQDVLGVPLHDNWWQTETGGIMVANVASMAIKPGSMGKPVPGVEAAIVRRSDDGTQVEVLDTPNAEGELALRPGWPSMFRGYLHDDERYRKCFVGGWYLTGDLAKRDEDGYYWFVGRADDVIKTSGHLIGPFEVESALMEHRAVAEAAVIGKPDPIAGAVLKAFVVLKPGVAASDDVKADLLGFARTRLGAVVAPKEIDLVSDLPKTRSGKIMRRLLRARELGLPEGDLSMLESGA